MEAILGVLHKREAYGLNLYFFEINLLIPKIVRPHLAITAV